MMKKTIALLLTVLAVFSCFSMGVSAAADTEEPQKTASGFYVGQQLKTGEAIRSSFDTCTSIVVIYSVDKADAENVTSAWQAKFSDESVKGVARFRDTLTNKQEAFANGYTIKGVGDVVSELETEYNQFQNATEIYASLTEDELKALKIKQQFELTIDYDYAHTTYNQYNYIAAWEITTVQDGESSLEIRAKAVFATREPTNYEQFQEKNYANWLKFLDKLGDLLLKIVPKIFAIWAKMLGKK